jgi:hypothetical protein
MITVNSVDLFSLRLIDPGHRGRRDDGRHRNVKIRMAILENNVINPYNGENLLTSPATCSRCH